MIGYCMTKKQLAYNLNKLVRLVRNDTKDNDCGEFVVGCKCSQCLRIKLDRKRIQKLKQAILLG